MDDVGSEERVEGSHALSWVRPSLLLAQVVRALPEFRGRDRALQRLLRSVHTLDATLTGSFGGGLRFEGNPAVDANVVELLVLRFARPALASLLDATLVPGGVFADIGANLGLYTLWGARLVGATGRVYAFEPVPETRARLERNVSLNGLRNVSIVAAGVGAEPDRVTLYRLPGTSGMTSRFLESKGDAVEVSVTTLDTEFPDSAAAPDLIKIDVEGMEPEVLRGGRRLLGGPKPPLVVFESSAGYLHAAGIDYPTLRAYLKEAGGYSVWALRPDGLRPEPPGAVAPGSLNVLAAQSDTPAHRRVLDRLARVRFPRNLNA